jgi:hypothetical protein
MRLLPALLLLAAVAAGKNIDLVTLPDRASVQLTIYNSEDLTLVKETRLLTLKKGRNELQFSWANTLIDPTSVEFRPLERADEIELVDTLFPGAKPQHLVWKVDSRYEGPVRVEVTYFTSGITWSMDYVAVLNPGEEAMSFRGYVRVSNGSGEEYEGAQVRLIVGRINLVEKIAELAQRRGLPAPAPKTPMFERLKEESARGAFAKADARDQAGGKEIVKEGLSEYFMFTVEGKETIPHGWSKRMEAVRAGGLKFSTVYRLREHQYGPRPVRFLVWKNDAEHGLGDSPLPDGRVRVLRSDAEEALSLLGEQMVSYVPIQAPIEVNLGADDRVSCETIAGAIRRYDFRFHDTRPPRVTGWTEEAKALDHVRNSRDREIVFELQRVIPGDVEYSAGMATTLFDYRTIEARFTVKPRGEVLHAWTVVRRLGASQRQERVELR